MSGNNAESKSEYNHSHLQLYQPIHLFFNEVLPRHYLVTLSESCQHVFIEYKGVKLVRWTGSELNDRIAAIKRTYITENQRIEINRIVRLINGRNISVRYFLELLMDFCDLNFHHRELLDQPYLVLHMPMLLSLDIPQPRPLDLNYISLSSTNNYSQICLELGNSVKNGEKLLCLTKKGFVDIGESSTLSEASKIKTSALLNKYLEDSTMTLRQFFTFLGETHTVHGNIS